MLDIRKYLYNRAQSLFFNRYEDMNYLGDCSSEDRGIFESLLSDGVQNVDVEVVRFEKESGFSICLDWMHELALVTQVVRKSSDLSFAHGRVLYSALSAYLSDLDMLSKKAGVFIFETGSARGFSSLCMAKALSDNRSQGRILSVDVLPHLKKIHWNSVTDIYGAVSRQEMLAPWAELVNQFIIFLQLDSLTVTKRLSPGRINFAFLDAAHTFVDVMREFEFVSTRQCSGDIIVFDDYGSDQFPGVTEAVDKICDNLLGYEGKVIRGSAGRSYVLATKA